MLYYLPSSQKGLTLIEASVSAAVVAVSLLGILRLQTQLSKDNADSPVRTAALNAAQQKLEELRAFQRVSGIESYERLSCGTDNPMADPDTTPLTNATLSRVCTVGAEVNGYKPVTVTVSWADARGETQQVRLSSYIAKTDPVQAGILLAGITGNTTSNTTSNTTGNTTSNTTGNTTGNTTTQSPSVTPPTCSTSLCCSATKNINDFNVVFKVEGNQLSNQSFEITVTSTSPGNKNEAQKNGSHFYDSNTKTVTQKITTPNGSNKQFQVSLKMTDATGTPKTSSICYETN